MVRLQVQKCGLGPRATEPHAEVPSAPRSVLGWMRPRCPASWHSPLGTSLGNGIPCCHHIYRYVLIFPAQTEYTRPDQALQGQTALWKVSPADPCVGISGLVTQGCVSGTEKFSLRAEVGGFGLPASQCPLRGAWASLPLPEPSLL